MLLLFAGVSAGCAAHASDPPPPPSSAAAGVAPAWAPLMQRLQSDGLDGPDLVPLFAALGETPSQDPMGRKIRELYTRKFAPKPAPKPADAAGKTVGKGRPKTPARPPVYPGVVTRANAERCAEFLKRHKAAFDAAERLYGVPREIAVSLMFVETRLGDFLGKESAFRTLASMAASREPSQISDYLAGLPGAASHQDWIREIMERRSDWAYREFVALLGHARAAGANPLVLPGSIYGAVGLCQFMPSNIATYGADGNGDGVVDLFAVPDAVASLSNYLVKNGWKPGLTRLRQHRVVKSYNRVNIYANTVLALADAVRKAERR